MIAIKWAAAASLAAALLLLAAPQAFAQVTDEQMELCGNDGSSADRRDREILAEAIVACTAIIAVGGEAPMSYAHYFRGLAYSGQRDHARAIADFGEAIRYDPLSVGSFYQRSRAHSALGDETRAAADLAHAAALDPTLLAVYRRAEGRKR